MKSAKTLGRRSRRTIMTALSVALVAGMALLSPVPAQAAEPEVTISGEARVGQTLTFTTDCTNIDQMGWRQSDAVNWLAFGPQYTVQASDVGHSLVLSLACGAEPIERLTAVVVPGYFDAATFPVMSGTARVGQTITTSPGEWSPTPDSISYQWRRGGDAIEGQTSSSYTLVSADHGKWVSVQVTVNRDGYTQASLSAGSETVVAGPVDARGVTVTSLTAGTPVVGTDNCVSIPMSIAYQVSSESASTLTALTATAQVRNSAGVDIGTVTLSSTDSALSGVASGTYQRCSSDVRGVLSVSGLSGSYSGLFSAEIVNYSKRPSSEAVHGTFESSVTASATVPTVLPTPTPSPTPTPTPRVVKRAGSKIIYVQAFRSHSTRTVIGKVVVYNAKVKRWVAVSGGPKLILQKQVKGAWAKVLTTKASKAAWFKATWKASKKATYRLIRSDRKTVVSKTFSR
jgi:hypothetical protein